MQKLAEFGFICTVVISCQMWSVLDRRCCRIQSGNHSDADMGPRLFKVELNWVAEAQRLFSLA